MEALHPRILRQLESSAAAYRVLRHDAFASPIRSPKEFAAALGWPIERIAKTLLLRSQDRQPPFYCAVTLPAPSRIDFKVLEKLLGFGHLQVATQADLAEVLGYPSLGVSPLGNEGIPVIVDRSLMGHETIAVGGGAVGVEIEIAPSLLVSLCRAQVENIG